ncbi:hypothetical protein ACHAXT_001251 [Thalassiosira profunda]
MSASPSNPPLIGMSHEDGSSAALRVFFVALCVWEGLYHASRLLLKAGLDRYPEKILSPSLSKSATTRQHQSNGNGRARSPADDAKRTLLKRGPSYVVSLTHSFYATARGVMHLHHLLYASSIDKLFIEGYEPHRIHRIGHLGVVRTNTVFLSYLCYDLMHILSQYPKLGGVDTVMHHLIFASCSVINGTFGIFPFAFGWLIVGELSTIFLNMRWFLLKSGRDKSQMLDAINQYFAASFFLTRIGIYTVGVVQLYLQIDEILLMPEKSGVPIALLGMTLGGIMLGWVLNLLWGYKIFEMVRGVKTKKKQQ